MRLAIIRRRYNPYGGAERFIERLTPMLAERGIETTIISANWVSQKESSIPVIDVGVQGWSRSAKFKSFAENVDVALRNQQVSKRFDLIQTHERLTGAHLYRAGDGVHGAWFNRLQRESGPIKSWWLARDPYHRAVIETERKMAADKSLLYVANSRMIFEELQQYLSIDLNRINLIPNGVDVTRFTPCSAEQKRDSREMLAKLRGFRLSKKGGSSIDWCDGPNGGGIPTDMRSR
jgi:UDP-glucose:(heptosyl)LPS alpha-1,3-glucosyltransferase